MRERFTLSCLPVLKSQPFPNQHYAKELEREIATELREQILERERVMEREHAVRTKEKNDSVVSAGLLRCRT